MLSEKLQNISESLRSTLRHVDPDRAAVIRQCCRNIEAGADQARALEGLPVAVESAASCLMDRPPLPHEISGVRHG